MNLEKYKTYIKESIEIYIDKDYELLVPVFKKNQIEAIRKIITLLKEKDYDTIKFYGHRIKGTAQNYGFYDIGLIGEYIESENFIEYPEKLIEACNDIEKYLKIVKIKFIEM